MTKIVVLDAGHGGSDPGATGFGLREKDLTLDRVLAIKKKLETEYKGVKVILTRNSDTYPSLSQRAHIANSAKADLFISDHKNAYNGQARGFETFTYSNASTASRAYQNVIHREVYSRIKKYGIPDRGQKSANYQVLRETKMPAVLLEEAFIDNKKDNDLLRSSAFKNDYVEGVVAGIAKSLGLQKKEVTQMDNKPSEWAKSSWEKATKAKVVDGTRPQEPVTREQLAVILDRLGLIK